MLKPSISQVMMTNLVTVHAQASIDEVEQAMLNGSSSCVFVVGPSGQLQGVIPDYDLLKHRWLNGDPHLAAEQIMIPASFVLTAQDSAEQAILYLREHVHAQIPIVEEGRLVGIVTRLSILKSLFQGCARKPSTLPPPKFLNAHHTPEDTLRIDG